MYLKKSSSIALGTLLTFIPKLALAGDSITVIKHTESVEADSWGEVEFAYKLHSKSESTVKLMKCHNLLSGGFKCTSDKSMQVDAGDQVKTMRFYVSSSSYYQLEMETASLPVSSKMFEVETTIRSQGSNETSGGESKSTPPSNPSSSSSGGEPIENIVALGLLGFLVVVSLVAATSESMDSQQKNLPQPYPDPMPVGFQF